MTYMNKICLLVAKSLIAQKLSRCNWLPQVTIFYLFALTRTSEVIYNKKVAKMF